MHSPLDPEGHSIVVPAASGLPARTFWGLGHYFTSLPCVGGVYQDACAWHAQGSEVCLETRKVPAPPLLYTRVSSYLYALAFRVDV